MESLFPGDNEIIPETTGSGTYKTPEFKFWTYFFKTISNDGDDYHAKFTSQAKISKNGKIDWTFWIDEDSPSGSSYNKAINVLIAQLARGEMVFGQDDVKKFRSLIKEIISHRNRQLIVGTPSYDNHSQVLKLWKKVQDVLSKVKAKEDGPSFSFMALGTVLVIAVFWYLQQQSKDFARE